MAQAEIIEPAETNGTDITAERDELIILDENENNGLPQQVAPEREEILFIE